MSITNNISEMTIPYKTQTYGERLLSSEWNANFSAIEQAFDLAIIAINQNFTELALRLPEYELVDGNLSVT